MDERVLQFRVGVVVLATLLIAAILIVLFGDTRSLLKGQKTINVTFDRAPGIAVNTPVRKSGILIGRVTDVKFDEEGGVIVTTSVDADVPLHRSDTCRILSSLLGDAAMEFVPSEDPKRDKTPLPDGAVVQGVVTASPLEMVANLEDDLTTAIDAFGQAGFSIRDAGKDVGELATRFNNFFENNDVQVRRIVEKTERALDGVTQMTATINNLMGDEKFQQDMRRALAQLPELLDETRDTITGIQRVSTLAEKNLTNLQGFTGPLGERGEELVNKVESSVSQLDELLSQFVTFGKAVNSPEGSMGQLINNPDLYQKLNRAASNIEEASYQLRPILNDVRVFTDKVARDPSRVGVGGALRGRSLTK